jgi:glycosyltransferase involved in cell wall biosynthesis
MSLSSNLSGSERPPRVCVVTSELIGLFRNGGVGTAMTGIVELLARARFPVTVLYTGAIWSVVPPEEAWTRKYAAIGVDLRILDASQTGSVAGPVKDLGFPVPYLVYSFLQAEHFDIVHFNDMLGEGYYCLTAKRLGLAFAQTMFSVGVHSPSRWVLDLNGQIPNSILYAAFDYAEHTSIQCADVLWTPSLYMQRWLSKNGYKLPARVILQQYVMPSSQLFDPLEDHFLPEEVAADRPRERRTPTEIVFFGRLERRKGLDLFCAALDESNKTLSAAGIVVTFLGKSVIKDEIASDDYIARRAEKWTFQWKIITGFGQQEAIEYLQTTNSVAVMASPEDNSPCTVYEALLHNIPFLATRTGGIPELVAADQSHENLFEFSTSSLADALARVIRSGISCARPAVPPRANRQQWLELHREWGINRVSGATTSGTEQQASISPLPRILVVIDAWSQGVGIDVTLASLEQSLGPELCCKLIVIHRHSDVESSRPEPPSSLSVVNTGVGDFVDVFHAALRTSECDIALFVVGGVSVRPEMSRLLAAISQCEEIDGLIPTAVTSDGLAVPPIGGSAAFAFFEGTSFTGGAAIKSSKLTSCLGESLPLCPSVTFFGIPDIAVANGLVLWPALEPVFATSGGLPIRSREAPNVERLRHFAQVTTWDRYYIMGIGHHGYTEGQLLHWERSLWMQFAQTSTFRSARAVWRALRACRDRLGLRSGSGPAAAPADSVLRTRLRLLTIRRGIRRLILKARTGLKLSEHFRK